MITDDKFNPYAQGTTIVPGDEEVHSSFRSELTGILAILEMLHIIEEQHQMQMGAITIFCDNISAVNVMNNWGPMRMTPRHKNADVINACLQLQDTSVFSLKCEHVLGHQDDAVTYHQLSPQAQINVQMDVNAKALANMVINNPGMRVLKCNHPAAMKLPKYESKPIFQQVTDALYQHITSSKVHYR